MKEKPSPLRPQQHQRSNSGSFLSVPTAAGAAALRHHTNYNASRDQAPRSGPAWFGPLLPSAAASTAAATPRSAAAQLLPPQRPATLKSPAELGRRPEEMSDESKRKHGHDNDDEKKNPEKDVLSSTTATTTLTPRAVHASPTVIGMRRRKAQLVAQYAASSPIAERVCWEVAAAATETNSSNSTSARSTCVTAFTYCGMEIWMGTVGAMAYVCTARAPHWVLQQLSIDKNKDMGNSSPIISVRSHPNTGQIVLLNAVGIWQAFLPSPCPATEVSTGRFRWHPCGNAVDAAQLFGISDKILSLASSCSSSLSMNHKWLLAADDQLAVWDVSGKSSRREKKSVGNEVASNNDNDEPTLLWMTRLPSTVRAAAMAGDGQALAVVLDSNSSSSSKASPGDDDVEAEGVHTFERDQEDGAELETENNSELYAEASVVYKPGPFLVHSAAVTRLEFRGQGLVTSAAARNHGTARAAPNKLSMPLTANDLLLTTAADGTARIFGQQAWRPLTEWVCGRQTRVDWIRGQAALSLGDLEAPKPKPTASTTSTGGGGDTAMPNSASTGGVGASLPSIPAHTTPLSQAGAWIAEISWQSEEEEEEDEDAYNNGDNDDRKGAKIIVQENKNGRGSGVLQPWISLSRLTYLKRGTGDLTPTLLESVSAILPPVSVMRDTVLGVSDTLQVEGLWPAWNPFFVSSSRTEQLHGHRGEDMAETLRGSAMAFLGLAQTDGYFGDALLQGTQCPPTELRLTVSHPVSGHVVLLEFHLHGQDKNLNTLELGAPHRSVVNLAQVVPPTQSAPSTDNQTDANSRNSNSVIKKNLTVSTVNGKGALVAQTDDAQRIQLHWNGAGSLALVPTQWMSTDIMSPPPSVAGVLKATTRWKDESVLPAPLALRPLPAATHDDLIALLQWWPERRELEPLYGPRYLIAWKESGCAVVLPVLTPLAERTNPEEACLLSSGVGGESIDDGGGLQKQSSGRFRRKSSFAEGGKAVEFEVSIVPDPEYGLGLRLESLDDGEPAIAGSFKKNPSSGDRLPAERTEQIALGDELVSVNGVNLEDKSFDDVIHTVREFGASASPGNPIRMRFRRKHGGGRVRTDSAASSSDNSANRTMEQIFGVRRENIEKANPTFVSSVSTLGNSQQDIEAVSQPLHETAVVARLAADKDWAGVLADNNSEKRMLLLQDPCAPCTHEPPPALLITAMDTSIKVHRLKLRLPNGRNVNEKKEGEVLCEPLGELTVPDVKVLNLMKTTRDQVFLVAASPGLLQTVVFRLSDRNDAVTFTTLEISNQDLARPTECMVRSHSLHLLATSEPENGRYRNITIWTPQLHPGCPLANVDETNKDLKLPKMEDYCKTVIHVEAISEPNNCFVDFCFARSGFLDSSPLLLTFSKEGVSAYQRREGSFDWVLVTTVLYGYSIEGLSLSSRPLDTVPHLVSAVRACFSSHDEDTFLRSDWHPDTILAQICTHKEGVQKALQQRIRSLFNWLVTEGRELLEDFHHLPLLCPPLSIYNEGVPTETPTSDANAEQAFFGLSYSGLASSQDEKNRLLMGFRDMLAKHLKEPSLENSEIGLGFLRSLKAEDVRILLAILEIILDPPAFKHLDPCGEHFLFSSSLLGQFFNGRDEFVEKVTPKFEMPGVLQRQGSSFSSSKPKVKALPLLASAACVSGLMSSSQERIIEAIKGPGGKLDWKQAKQLRIPFWMRSDASLARVAEEIGQTIFRDKRDIMESAIFFIISRKTKKLRNLAATDQSESGRKFVKFINAHDFTSERGRRAAEKNAFSLLRKCKYQVASAFFLLSPSGLQSALETIVTKMQDHDLAFMVARLMESKDVISDVGDLGSLRSGGGLMNFGGMLGGGGGYAGAGSAEPPMSEIQDSELFENWKPDCKRAAKRLLVERCLPAASSDPALSSVFLLWLNKREEAAWWLSGFLEASPSSESGYRLVRDTRCSLTQRLKDSSQYASQSRIASLAANKVNAFLDFTSSPFLLHFMKSSARSQSASALLVAETMIARGVHTPSLLDILRTSDFSESGRRDEVPSKTSNSNGSQDHTSSSIFDSYAPVPIPQKVESKPPPSIFDNFDPPPPVKQPQSSIFDQFEQPQRKVPSGNPQSSIFDSFDYKPAQKDVAPSAPQSSIFDSYDVPKPATKPSEESSQGTMQSSIFDNFDVPQPAKKTPSPNSTGAMQSSIFDPFDVPAPQAKSGSSNTSVFDAYYVPSGPTKAKSANDGSTTIPVHDSSPASDNNESKKELPPVPEITLSLSRTPLPAGWSFLSDEVVLECASRRFCRTVATVLASFHGDPVQPSIEDFFENLDSFIPSGASDVLQLTSDVASILTPIEQALEEISTAYGIRKELIADAAVEVIAAQESHYRGVFGSLIYVVLGRIEAAEALVRNAAESILQGTAHLAYAIDGCALRRRTRSTISTLFSRREAVRICWQLESCLWLHRGGGLPLSSLALKKAIVAVRMGLTVGSWNRHHETLESLLKCEPDCLLDDDAGRYLWSSLKDPTPLDIVEEQPKKTTSGGWEFLVDCRRTEATEILRESPTGSFIIRPHPSDHGVFTLSFKTNLMPGDSNHDSSAAGGEQREQEANPTAENESHHKTKSKGIRKDDVVQHAIIRLSDSGFRCGSFGPFSSLIDLLEAVSSSLPFKLRFDLPPQNRVIREEGSQPSPNAVLFRKLALGRADSIVSNPPTGDGLERYNTRRPSTGSEKKPRPKQFSAEREQAYSCFLELLVLSRLRRQFSSIASVKYADESEMSTRTNISMQSEGSVWVSAQQSQHNAAYWMLHPLLSWCRCMEVRASVELTPETVPVRPDSAPPMTDFSEKSIEITLSSDNGGKFESCDTILRRLIQRDSGIEFSTLRLVDGGDCTMVVLFSKAEAIKWLVSTGTEDSEEAALDRLSWMEGERVIEAVDLAQLPLKQRPADMDEGIRYRIVDPWEVEAVNDREGETRSACLGRQQYHAFSLGKIALACENDFRSLGGLALLELWTSSKGGVIMSRALACVHPPWERSAGGDLQVSNGHVKEPEPFDNAIRQHLYRNSLFRRLGLPQRFMALVQVELLDLKNLTSPTGSLSLSVYGLLRLKRKGSSSVLSNKTRTLDTAQTHPVRLGKPTGVGPHAPATWGSVVRFRFPLPEGVNVDGTSLDSDRDSLFRGPPSVLQISVYEKKLLVDTALGTADIATDGLWAGGQLEEWVPLRSEKHGGIHWFARIRLTLRFELMCKIRESGDLAPPSVGIQRMTSLTSNGGAAHEDHKRSMSSPDLLGYLESMVY